MWRRIGYRHIKDNTAVSNTDDHLRNHGFVLSGEGWKLSPVYDVNPDADGDVLSLNVDKDNNLIDYSLALSVSKMYEMSREQAEKVLDEIKGTVESNWKKLAQKYGLHRGEIERMMPAFDMNFKE